MRTTAKGARQRYECLPLAADPHFFTLAVSVRRAGAEAGRLRCPEPRHADARVLARGTRVSKTGVWARYSCVRPDGSKHYFQVLRSADGSAVTSMDRPPPCHEHPGSKVTRNGKFGKASRQRYKCVPTDANATHSFTPPLTRETVEVGQGACSTCDELLSPHRGPMTGARHTPWTLKSIAKALNDLSLGSSYAAVSLAMREHRSAAAEHLLNAHGQEVTLGAGALVQANSGSWTTEQGKNAWHLAADLVEQYSPLLFARATATMSAREARQRAANDAALAADPDASLAMPLTYILDELPVVVSAPRANRVRFEQRRWSLLVAVEVRWRKGADPMALPAREARLRLVRAYPRGNAQAWRLVLDELGVRPDFIVADASPAISRAVSQQYGESVGLIPSLYHAHVKIREGLMKLPGTTMTVQGRNVLVPELAKLMDLLTRTEVLSLGPAEWSTWWDELIAAVRAVPAPVVTLAEQRKLYEPLVEAALPLLVKQPQLPASNAAVETRIRQQLEPFLENRKHLYRNLARTNYLYDLAVCRDQGLFADLDKLTKLIRDSNEAAGGWAPAPRQVTDAQPAPRADGTSAAKYSSLLNPMLVPALTKKRLAGRS